MPPRNDFIQLYLFTLTYLSFSITPLKTTVALIGTFVSIKLDTYARLDFLPNVTLEAITSFPEESIILDCPPLP